MSVCNVSITSERILILSDTLVYSGSEPIALAPRKTCVSIDGKYAHCWRGDWTIADVGAHAIAFMNFADANKFVGEWMKAAKEKDVPKIGIECFLVGVENNELVAIKHNRFPRQGYKRVVLESNKTHWHPGDERTYRVLDEQEMVRFAIKQQPVAKAFTDFPIGGAMHITTVTKSGATQAIAGLYPDYFEHAARFEDPNAEIIAELFGRKAA